MQKCCTLTKSRADPSLRSGRRTEATDGHQKLATTKNTQQWTGAKRSGVAGDERSHFDDGIGKLAHGADEGFDKVGIELGISAAFEFA